MKKVFKYYLIYDVNERQYYQSTSGGDVCFTDEIEYARKFQNPDTIAEDMYDWEAEDIFENRLIEVKIFMSTNEYF